MIEQITYRQIVSEAHLLAENNHKFDGELCGEIQKEEVFRFFGEGGV